eukprot:m.62174 g.62174  ORF g.62174 m.62174 type:complete len:238 (+) comp11492_c0_seq1:307-1020(+)
MDLMFNKKGGGLIGSLDMTGDIPEKELGKITLDYAEKPKQPPIRKGKEGIKYHTHIINSSDTLRSLSMRYNVPMEDIKKLNNLGFAPSINYLSEIKIPLSDNAVTDSEQQQKDLTTGDGPAVENSKASVMSFLDKFDSKFTQTKQFTSKLPEAPPPAADLRRTSSQQMRGALTKEGKIKAHSQAVDRIATVLTGGSISVDDQAPTLSWKTTKADQVDDTSAPVSENDMDKDVDLFQL